MKVLVTGANGFVGRRLCPALAERGLLVRAVSGPGMTKPVFPEAVEKAFIDNIWALTDWTKYLRDIDVIIHLAARVHVMSRSGRHAISQFRRINAEGTKNLALQAGRAGIKRLVFLSTIKVNGEQTLEKPFSEADPYDPRDAYAASKAEAEEALREVSASSGLKAVIIRSPLVYGPGVKGNLLRMMQAIKRDLPVPLGNINNRRSLISLDNLVDVLILAATREEALGQTFVVSDGEDFSTTDLAKMMAAAMGKKGRLISCPSGLLRLASRLAPRLKPDIDRLTGSLVIDSSKFRNTLGWTPPQKSRQGIEMMVFDHLRKKGHDG